ncbi:hypothetical protein KSW81_000144 [Nannochloris sp. 'desiccata']|nr:hypothetical protein KSW81_000144 [Chlorella desiccata (nom. nud.)]
MAGSLVHSDLWRKIAIGAAIVIIFVFITKGVRLQNAQDDDKNAQQTNSRLLPVDDSGEDPFAVQWLGTKLRDLDLQHSSFKCSNADNVYKTCIFVNMVMYRGDLWYISDQKTSRTSSSSGKKVILPEPLVFEVGNSPSNNFNLPEIISITTKSEALSKIQATAPKTGKIRLAQFDISIFQRTRTFNNWFWALNGAGNIFHRLCKYFDACTATDIKQAAVLQPIIESSRNLSDIGYLGLPHHHAQTVKDLIKCFGPLLWVNHPSGREVEERPVDEVIVFKKMLVGIGEDVVQPKAALDENSEVRFEQAEADISLQRVQYIRQCAGLTPAPTEDSSFDITRISNQAEAFDAANIIVAPHGAATANFNFLPYDAVALGVFALPGRWGHDEAVGASMPAPPYNITVWKVDCQAATEARTNAVSELPEFLALDAEDQIALLFGKEMNSERVKQVKSLLGMSLLDWMDYRSYAPDPVELTDQVLAAVGEWEVKNAVRKKQRKKGNKL